VILSSKQVFIPHGLGLTLANAILFRNTEFN
jgi:hypothetical protein